MGPFNARPVCRTLQLVLILLTGTITMAAQTPAPTAPLSGQKYVPGHVLVKFRPGVRVSSVQAAHQAVLGQVVRTFPGVEGLELVRLAPGGNLSRALKAYRGNANVLYAEPDYVVHASQTPTDPLFPQMWGLRNTGQTGGTIGADIHATQAWNITTGSSSVVVAVIDTGIDYTHPDLAANVFSGPICAGGTICHGFNAITGADPNDPLDDNGHGTHVSGTIGAIGSNSLGVTGVNWNVKILPCKFLDSQGFGSASGAIACLDFIKNARDSGVNVVASNNSWGGGLFSQALQDAIDRQRQSGILFIAAAGNDFADNDTQPSYPASYPLPNVVAVAATDRNDGRAFFSNFGRHTVHIGAPGQEILSTFLGGGYATESGTSMATPHVTGVAALLAAQDPTRDWRAIRNLILAGGDPNAEMAKTVTGKRLNAFGALTCANSIVSSRLLPATDVVSASAGVPVVLSALNVNCAQPNGTVSVTVTPGGQIIPLADDGAGADMAAGDGIYSGQFVPASPGVYTLSFSTGDVVVVEALINYQPLAAPFSYRNIAGTSLNLGDDDVTSVNSPFPIAFGNGSFSRFWVSANGTISFDGAFSAYLHEFIPTFSPFLTGHPPLVPATTLVAPFWDDLLPLKNTAQNVFWDVTGTAPNRELVVEWRDVRAFDCPAEQDTVKFQVVFFESSSDVLFNYGDAVFGGSCIDHDRGNDATEGIQVAPSVGTAWGFNGQDVNDGMAIIWHTSSAPPPPLITPVLTSISPAAVDGFGPGFTLTVDGSNFVPESRVTLFGFQHRATTLVSGTRLTAFIPASDIDLFRSFDPSIVVTVQTPNPAGFPLQSQPATLTVNVPKPAIATLSPPGVAANGFGFILTVTGTGFTQFPTVFFNGQPLITVAQNNTELQAFITGDLIQSAGVAQIKVQNQGGNSSAPVPFTISLSATPPPLTSSQAYRIESTPSSPGRIVLGSKGPTGRFFGWNYAQQQGTEFLKAFVRPYGDLFALSGQDQAPATAGAGAVAVPLSLPGLDLRDSMLTGFLPTGVATGDFNHDGHLDWVVCNGGSNDLWIYLGNGDGTFQPPRIIPLRGQTPLAVAAADLRGIGTLDLIVAEPDSLTVGVLLGNNDGTFGPESLYFTPAPALSLAVADFNGDGHPDVVVGLIADNPIGALAFLAGDGAGRLKAPVFTPLDREFSPAAVVVNLAAGDFNNDGFLDLAVTDQNPLETGIYIYFGKGDGTFKKGPNLGGLFGAAVGDLNGDGCLDVITLNDSLYDVMLGHCDGTFQTLQPNFQFGEGEVGVGVSLADVNGDGKLDLITSGVNVQGAGGGVGVQSGSLLSVQLGNGTGGFDSPRVYRGRNDMFALAAGDFNGDSHVDFVAASQNSDSAVLFLNDGTGRFGGPQGRYVGWFETGKTSTVGPTNAPVAAYPADLDGDGKKDLLFIDFGESFALPWNIVSSLNDGLGNFLFDIKSPVMDSRFQFFGNLVLGDFRKLGRLDAVLTPNHLSSSFTGNFFVFVPNLGGGHFGTPVITNINELPGKIEIGDFNKDGNLDFVMVGPGSTGLSPVQVSMFLGNGDGTFRAGPTQGFSGSSLIPNFFVGDFNGDGNPDILVPNNGGLVEFLGNGDGSFGAPRTVIPNLFSFSDPSSLFAVADLNHDGRTDLIQRNGVQDSLTPVFKIYFAQPDGTFALQNTYTPYSGSPFNAGGPSFVADFNGDGNLDIAAYQEEAGTLYVQFMLGNGDGTFTPTFNKFPLTRGSSAPPSFATDMNGDGRADIVELDGFSSAFNVIHSVPGTSLRIRFVGLPVIGSQGLVRVSLAVPAPQDTTVQLSVGDPAITVPPSVMIPSGSLSTDFILQVGNAFDFSHAFTVTAQAGLESATATGFVGIPGANIGLRLFVPHPFQTIFPGQTTADYGAFVFSVGGYQSTVNLKCTGLPSGAACNFSTLSLQIPAGGFNSTTLTVTADANLPLGTYPFNVIVDDGVTSTQSSATLTVVPDPAHSPNLTISKTHSGNFTAGAPGTYTINVGNVGGGPTFGTVTMTDSLPSGLTAGTVGGTGWSCAAPLTTSVVCTRSDALAANGSYPSISLTVNVDPGAPAFVTNRADVTGGEDTFVHIVNDPTNINLPMRFVAAAPCRIADTRNAAGPFGGPFLKGQAAARAFTIPAGACNIPASATAYSLNVTVVPHGTLGFLTTFPCGNVQPLASTLNSVDGRTKAVAAIVPAGNNGNVCFFATHDTELVLDIDGYFVPATAPASLAFYPLPPCRLVDTRLANGPLGGPALVGGATRSFPLPSSPCNVPLTAQAYSLNFTSVPHGSLGFLTTWPTGQTQPLVSTLNAPTGAVTANAAMVPAGAAGAISVFVTDNSDLVIDVNGYFAPPAAGGLSLFNLTPCRVLDTRNPVGSPAFAGTINVNVAAAGCGAPATAGSYVLNATVVPPASLGFLTLWPQGSTQPLVSSLNAQDGAITSNMAIVPAASGSISAFASNSTHLVLDISGYFATIAAALPTGTGPIQSDSVNPNAPGDNSNPMPGSAAGAVTVTLGTSRSRLAGAAGAIPLLSVETAWPWEFRQ